jgi:Ca-activated chloride channel family protein
MEFQWPLMLLLLGLLPLFIGFYLRLQRLRRALAARYGSLGFVQEAPGRGLGARRHLPPALFLIGLAVLLVALARPQAQVSLPRVEGTVMLVFDVSGSMAADDLQPTRMEAAKVVARDFVLRQPETVQVGVVAFSSNGFAVQPPTSDQDAVLAAINRLAPQRGTALAQGIFASLNAIYPETRPDLTPGVEATPPPTPTAAPAGSNRSAVMVLLTDGENNEAPDPLAAAQAAADRGVRVHTIGIGSPDGAILQVEGLSVHTRLDEPTLQLIAEITGGSYYNAQNEEDLRAIYEGLTPHLVVKPEKIEVTSLFAGASILMLLMGGMFSLMWFSRLP